MRANWYWQVLRGHFMQYTLIRLLLLLYCGYTQAVTPVFLSHENLCKYAVEKRKDKRQLAAIIDNYFKNAEALTTNKDPEQLSFITDTEIKELEIPWLIDTLDYTQTPFGRQFLQQSMQLLTADTAIIQERQRIEKLLYVNSDLLHKVQNILHAIGGLQGSFLSYFDSADRLNFVAQNLYFDGSSLSWINNNAASVIKKGNNYSTVLNLGIIGSIIKRCDSLFISLCKQSMADELVKITLGMSTSLNLDGFLFENIVNTFKGHIPWFKSFNPQTYDGNHGIYSTIMQEGTFADKVGAYVCGSTATDTSIGFKYLPISWRLKLRKQSDFTSWNTVPWYAKTVATLSLLIWTLYKDYRTIEDGKESVKKIQQLFKVMNALRARLMHVAQIINSIQELSTIINAHPEMSNTIFAQQLHMINAITHSAKFNELSTLLTKIASNKSAGIAYNYGIVLRAHRLLHEIKHEFIPVLEAVGQLDAYCSIATALKQHQERAARFSFVEFVNQQEPCVHLQDCWVPLINPERVVTNDIYIGLHGWGNKIIITGPNGGGKSTYLKALGQSVYLAHTFGIVPASAGSMTAYAGLRTCFHPRESLSEDMSQFMVEKKCMDNLAAYVQNRSHDQKIMLLIDEPYRGTVDAESAERIYAFGQMAAHIPQASVVIATHVYKPITLSQETKGIFTNCQVLIDQIDATNFNRTFKIVPGVATWWFADARKRANFVDWLALDHAIA